MLKITINLLLGVAFMIAAVFFVSQTGIDSNVFWGAGYAKG